MPRGQALGARGGEGASSSNGRDPISAPKPPQGAGAALSPTAMTKPTGAQRRRGQGSRSWAGPRTFLDCSFVSSPGAGPVQGVPLAVLGEGPRTELRHRR